MPEWAHVAGGSLRKRRDEEDFRLRIGDLGCFVPVKYIRNIFSNSIASSLLEQFASAQFRKWEGKDDFSEFAFILK